MKHLAFALSLLAASAGAAPVNLTCQVSDADQVPLNRYRAEQGVTANVAATVQLHLRIQRLADEQAAYDQQAVRDRYQSAKAQQDICLLAVTITKKITLNTAPSSCSTVTDPGDLLVCACP